MPVSVEFLILLVAAIVLSVAAKMLPGKKSIKIAAILAWILTIAIIVLIGFHLGSE